MISKNFFSPMKDQNIQRKMCDRALHMHKAMKLYSFVFAMHTHILLLKTIKKKKNSLLFFIKKNTKNT